MTSRKQQQELQKKKAFLHEGKWYIRVIPGKKLFRSTMVHEVVNRGDVFAVCLDDCRLTILPGLLSVQFHAIEYRVQMELDL